MRTFLVRTFLPPVSKIAHPGFFGRFGQVLIVEQVPDVASQQVGLVAFLRLLFLLLLLLPFLRLFVVAVFVARLRRRRVGRAVRSDAVFVGAARPATAERTVDDEVLAKLLKTSNLLALLNIARMS